MTSSDSSRIIISVEVKGLSARAHTHTHTLYTTLHLETAWSERSDDSFFC